MSKSRYKRKLTAILSADVVGDSRLMGDEESTIQTLKTYRDLMTTLIKQNRDSVVDAECQLSIASWHNLQVRLMQFSAPIHSCQI